MSFAGNFAVSQGTDISTLVLTDTSVGSDPNLTDRTISLMKIDGTLQTGSTIDFPIAFGSSITLPSGTLDKDYSFSILVTWASSLPIGGSTYQKTQIVTFVGYTNTFIYGEIQQVAANNATLNDDGFYKSMGKIQTEVDNSIQATNFSDQYSAQNSLSRANYMIQNKQLYF